MSERVELSIVLPCYNEAENLPLLLEVYARIWPKYLSAELVLVNNGSTDNSADVLALELAKPELHFARTVLVPKNRGYGFGMYTGLQAARGEFLALSHADMQCKPEDVFAAYNLLKSQPNPKGCFIKGRRGPREFGAELVTRCMSVISSTVLLTTLTDINAQPKVFHHSHLGRLKSPPDGIPFDLYVLYQAKRAGLQVLPIPVIFGKRGHGKSKWAFGFLRWRTFLNMIGYIFHLRFHPEG